MGHQRAAYLARCASGGGASSGGGSLHGSGARALNFSTPALLLGAPTMLIASNKDNLADPDPADGMWRLSLPSRAVLTLAPLAEQLGLVRWPLPPHIRMRHTWLLACLGSRAAR